MEITGKLIQHLPSTSGQSAKGDWKKQDAVIETAETYPKKVCISFWNDKVDDINKVSIGSNITIHFNLESREYNGKFYTEVKAWKIESGANAIKKTTTIDQVEKEMQEAKQPPPIVSNNDSIDDLPF